MGPMNTLYKLQVRFRKVECRKYNIHLGFYFYINFSPEWWRWILMGEQNGWVEKMMDEYRCMFCVSKLSRLFWKFAPFYFKLLRRFGFNCLIYGVINSYVLGCWPLNCWLLNRQYNSCNSIKLILLCSKHSIHNQTDLHLIFLVCLGESFHCFCFAEAEDLTISQNGTREWTYPRR